jgi:hypothetical protein
MALALPRSNYDSDRDLASRKGAVAIDDRTVLWSVEAQPEDNAVCDLELLANVADDQRTERFSGRAVTTAAVSDQSLQGMLLQPPARSQGPSARTTKADGPNLSPGGGEDVRRY